MNGEDARIQVLAEVFGRGAAEVGIGDDAAVLSWHDPNVVVSVDAQLEGTHFLRDWCSFEDIGYRSLMAAASDLAAMGAVPRAVVAALGLPREFSDADLRSIAAGQKQAADELGCSVVGGNLVRSAQLSLTTTVLGSAERPRLRSGAQSGDHVYIAGKLGLARAGLLSFERNVDVSEGRAAFRRPKALIDAGLAAAAAGVSACMDVSDGLAEDAPRLARASAVSLWLDSGALLAHGGDAVARAARLLGEEPLSLMLEGGEDYALLATGAATTPPAGFARIGEVLGRNSDGTSLFVDGVPLKLRGFSHFV